MKSALKLCLVFVTFYVLITSCYRSPETDHLINGQDTTLTPVPTPPSNSPGPSGMLYIDCHPSFRKISLIDSSQVWMTTPGDGGTAMYLDTLHFFSGSSKFIRAYSKKDGSLRWIYSWFMFSAAPVFYREPVVKDSLIYFTSASDNGSSRANLYCFNKTSGLRIWASIIDNGAPDGYFSPTPVLSDDKVLIATIGTDHRKHLTAFRQSDGKELWTSAPNDRLNIRLTVISGRAYSINEHEKTCYNINNGAVEWETHEPAYYMRGFATFLNEGQSYLVELFDTKAYVSTFNAIDGKLTKIGTFTGLSGGEPASGCVLAGNKLIVTNFRDTDSSINIQCFDVRAQTLTWERRIRNHITYASRQRPTPVLAGKWIVIPAVDSFKLGKYYSGFNFLNLDGIIVRKINVVVDVPPTIFGYEEAGILYNMSNKVIVAL